ncbi:MAG: TetR/AcrR family transcriptional regulator C-terminal domain-containing protein [candidate division KSB1 bacterium]|nr:TetR/AcrR family transcriptional regulator C-terminal domain-containing protein [candidate division KSB1 bacterium]
MQEIPDPADQVREFSRLHLEIVKTNPDLASVLQLELRQSNRFIKEYAGTSLNDYLNLIGDIIQNGQKANVFREDVHPGIAKRMLFGALDEISTLYVLLKDRSFDFQRSAAQIASIFLYGIAKDEYRNS